MPEQAAVIPEQDVAVRQTSQEASNSYAHSQTVPLRRGLEPRISLRHKSTVCPGRPRLIKSETHSVQPQEQGAAPEQTPRMDVVETNPNLRCILGRVRRQ
jgi:hypothetical protein